MSKITVAVIGNKRGCSFCGTLNRLIGDGKLAGVLPDATIIDADATTNSAAYKKWSKLASLSGSIPVIAVFDDKEKFLGKFVARKASSNNGTVDPWTVERVAEMINAYCPNCHVDEGTTTETDGCTVCSCGAKIAYCPSCGKKVC